MNTPSIQDDVTVVDISLERARQAFNSGITRPIEYRIKQIKQLLRGLIEKKKEISEAVRKDLGREEFATWFYEISIIEHDCEHVIKHLSKWAKPIAIDTAMLVGPAHSKIVYEPLGVICILGSWNFPLLTTLAPLIYAIAAGNSAVIKPSELSANSLLAIKSLCETYVDNETFICIEGQIEVAKALPTRKFDGLCFTGSTEKGKLVAAAASQNLIPCVLELGGKSPLVVDEDTDIELAAKKIAFGRFLNAGQACIAPDYVLVQENIAEQLIQMIKKFLEEFWQSGNNVADYGKIVSVNQQTRLIDIIKDQNIIHGGVVNGKLTPTVILNPSLDSKVMKEEIFGPILPIITFKSFYEVIKTINLMEKPLVVYYFGKQH